MSTPRQNFLSNFEVEKTLSRRRKFPKKIVHRSFQIFFFFFKKMSNPLFLGINIEPVIQPQVKFIQFSSVYC